MAGDGLQKEIDFTGCKQSLLGLYGVVELDKAIKAIQMRSGRRVIDIDRINEYSKSGMVYITNEGRVLYEVGREEEKLARYMVVPIGYTDKDTGKQLCASFMTGKFSWEGAYISTIDDLIERAIQNYNGNKEGMSGQEVESIEDILNFFKGDIILEGQGLRGIIEHNCHMKEEIKKISKHIETMNKASLEKENNKSKRTKKSVAGIKRLTHDINIDLYNKIYGILLVKEYWDPTNSHKLGIYLKALIEKVRCEQATNKTNIGNGYLLTEDKEKCLINIGLMDKFNNDIYIIDLNNKDRNFFRKRIITISSKLDMIKQGFKRENLLCMPRPIRFYGNKSELIFDGDISEFDIEDISRIYHIVHERKARLPNKYQELPSDVLCDKIKSAIVKAVKVSERDYKYIMPMYNLRANKIQYLIPLHMDRSLEEPPELVAVVGENNGIYSIFTTLTIEDAYDNARLICRPDSNWLRI